METKWVVADFETTTENFYRQYGYTKVWLYAISDPQGNILNFGDSIEKFFEYCKTNLNNYIIYFHNLKFDGSFILNYLIRNNFKEKQDIKYNDGKCYNTLISEEGQFYSIKVHLKRGVTITINDSLKIIPFKVEKIAKDFKLPCLKGEIDYSVYEINDVTLKYVFNDVKIVALALSELKQNGFVNMTAASSAYSYYISKLEDSKVFFPELDLKFLIEWREAYRGGRSQVNPIYADRVLSNVVRYDVNSMYPHIMRNCYLPIGKPIPIKRRDTYKFELYKVNIKFTLKKGHLPTLLKKTVMFGEQSYYTATDGLEILYLTSIDFKLVERHYNIEYCEFLEMYGFITTNKLFVDYIDYWYGIKNKEKGAKKQLAKLMLNSLYGKFGSNPMGKSKIPYLDENGVLKFNKGELEERKKYYLPLAMAVVSYAHLIIDDAIVSTGEENFVYCDTDSVHTLGSLSPELVDAKQLGKFKVEGVEIISRYVRQKTYVYKEINEEGKEEIKITCAGMNELSKAYAIETYGDTIFDNFKEGFTIEGYKLMPKQVKGGTILVKSNFKIKEFNKI